MAEERFMSSAVWIFNETSPSAQGGAPSVNRVQNAALYLPAGVAGPLDDYGSLKLTAELVGATGGTLDVYVQQNPGDDNVSWFDIAHFPQLTAAHAPIIYEAGISLYSQATAPVVIGKNASPALAANANVSGPFSSRLRLWMVAGSGTTVGAAVKVTLHAQRKLLREIGG
jgi:hypothetical protein